MDVCTGKIMKPKATVIGGGTGSQPMQKALIGQLGSSFEFSVLTNCYDNGKSTGFVRRLFNNKILGPSDLRKNQLLRHFLLQGQTELYQALNYRFTAKSLAEIETEVGKVNEKICSLVPKEYRTILKRIEDHFLTNLREKNLECLTDFSYTNVIYGNLAYSLKSMSAAGRFMAGLLNIPEDAVMLNSDENFFLKAITEFGHKIEDEGDIVNWCHPDDKITDILLEDRDGNLGIPKLLESAASLLSKSDLIIFSCGTQLSSLIPTYISQGFNEIIKRSSAAKYLIMNNTEDKDMKGVNSLGLLEIVSNYLDLSEFRNFTVVYNEKAQASMKLIDQRFNYIKGNLSSPNSKKHDGDTLVNLILSHYQSGYLTPKAVCR